MQYIRKVFRPQIVFVTCAEYNLTEMFTYQALNQQGSSRKELIQKIDFFVHLNQKVKSNLQNNNEATYRGHRLVTRLHTW